MAPIAGLRGSNCGAANCGAAPIAGLKPANGKLTALLCLLSFCLDREGVLSANAATTVFLSGESPFLRPLFLFSERR